jgi:benzoate-CoA ligase family protein
MAAHGTDARLNAAAEFLDRHVSEGRGGRTAFRYAGSRIRYATVADAAARAAWALAEIGVEMEQRVLLALSDQPAFATAFWGAVRLGAVAVPVNTFMGADEYAFVLDDSRARVAVVDRALAETFLALRRRCPSVKAVVVAGDAPPGALALDDLLARARTLEAAPTSPEDVMYWGYTSGSTGRPKAAVHTHDDFVAAADLVGVGVFGLSADDLVFSASKMFFAFGLGNTLYFPARVGAASMLVPERLDAERALALIHEERPTVFFAVATLYARMLQVPDAARRFDLSSLRLCVSSGEALPAPVFDAWRERFGIELADVVGSTEALHDFIATPPGKARRGSCGQIVPGFDARLVDDEGNDAPDGEPGHLLIRGPTTSPYYWKRRARTRATMIGEWLRTGDVMSRDAEGYYYFGGRADDMLKVSGLWVSPMDIEGVLAEHPAVAEAAVVGRANADGLVRPHAFVVVTATHVPSPVLASDILAFVRARAAAFKVPASIDLVEELPKTATGKIQRFRLRAGA